MAFARFRRNRNAGDGSDDTAARSPVRPSEEATVTSSTAEEGSPALSAEKNPAGLKRATRTRRVFTYIASFSYLVTVVFLILVEIGNTSMSPFRSDVYFFKLDIANVIAQSLPEGLTLTNSIARTLGLHDFYQVGLWNFCEGYDDTGVTYCGTPEAMWWFNPVDILMNELLSGASIALPNEVNEILYILEIASHVMFGFFIAGCVLSFILIFVGPVAIFSRWWSVPVGLFSFLNAVFVLGGSALGTAMALIAHYALSSQPELNVSAQVGVKMLAFMWVATAGAVLAFLIHAGMCCCCTSRRDIKTGRRVSRHMSVANSSSSNTEKEKGGLKLPSFKKSKRGASDGGDTTTG